MTDTLRCCAYSECGKVLVKRRGESTQYWLLREYCGARCRMAAYNLRALARRAEMMRPKLAVVIPDFTGHNIRLKPAVLFRANTPDTQSMSSSSANWPVRQ